MLSVLQRYVYLYSKFVIIIIDLLYNYRNRLFVQNS